MGGAYLFGMLISEIEKVQYVHMVFPRIITRAFIQKFFSQMGRLFEQERLLFDGTLIKKSENGGEIQGKKERAKIPLFISKIDDKNEEIDVCKIVSTTIREYRIL